jgi:hypothetical protein
MSNFNSVQHTSDDGFDLSARHLLCGYVTRNVQHNKNVVIHLIHDSQNINPTKKKLNYNILPLIIAFTIQICFL